MLAESQARSSWRNASSSGEKEKSITTSGGQVREAPIVSTGGKRRQPAGACGEVLVERRSRIHAARVAGHALELAVVRKPGPADVVEHGRRRLSERAQPELPGQLCEGVQDPWRQGERAAPEARGDLAIADRARAGNVIHAAGRG